MAGYYPFSGKVTTPPPEEPNRERERETVRALIEALWSAHFGMTWKGKGGLTERSWYAAMMREAWHYGRLKVPAGEEHAGETVQNGVWLSISNMQQAEAADVNVSTIEGGGNATSVIKRLQARGLLRRAGRGSPGKSGAYVLTTSHLQTRQFRAPSQGYRLKEETSIAGVDRDPELARVALKRARSALRWGASGSAGLGKYKEFLLDALTMLGDSATDRELAIAVGREDRVREARQRLDELVEERILARLGERYYRHRDTGIELTMTRATNGEQERDELQKEKHARRRQAYQLLRKLGQPPTKEEEANRRAEIAEIKRDAAARIRREQHKARERDRQEKRGRKKPEPSGGWVVGEPVPLPEPEPEPSGGFVSGEWVPMPEIPEVYDDGDRDDVHHRFLVGSKSGEGT